MNWLMSAQKLGLMFLVVGSAFIVTSGCDLRDDDFSDIKIIQEIIKKDAEEIYGIEKADDDSLFETSSLNKSQGNDTYRFQRRVKEISRKIEVTLIADTLAEAHIIYDVSGTFRVDSSLVTFAGKPFRHRLERYVGFVKRPERDSITGRTWRPTGFTPAFGASVNADGEIQTSIGFDSIFIKTPDAEYLVDDPGDLFVFYKQPIRVQDHDTILVRIKAFNHVDPLLDLPVGFLKSGRNNDRFSRKAQFTRIPGSFVYEYRLIVDMRQARNYNQLVIDFLTSSTILRRNRPYDSRLIMIPYRVR